ncbi:MAG: CDP-diacylglycerol--glycerol-3-phosphate 3-phosphatidyltransferase, partial [Candidatus Anoxychlamydiales bacterium]|nr:CDP-diacylglycerol--glycerol-3-phosphate 3-phosphatidyltransferase [Candidatus Anoxychlamydiales bacterium]
MITLSNALSIVRIPLALLFFWQNIYIRIIAIVLAMFTDSIDGYFARKYKSASKFGAYLDPAMDKFFVYFVLAILLLENHILLWQAFAMISRDF